MTTAVASPPGTTGEPSPKMLNKDDIKPSDRIPTPPTSEDMNKHDSHSSDLSDIEDNEVDMEDIKPDHYWDEENGGKIPVFKPVCIFLRAMDCARCTHGCSLVGHSRNTCEIVITISG
jgi:hypothetical protein